jgi:hypothetical protein
MKKQKISKHRFIIYIFGLNIILFNYLLVSYIFSQNFLEPQKFIKFYTHIVTANNDGVNDRLFLNYTNDEGKNLVLKIYDVKGILVFEKKDGK